MARKSRKPVQVQETAIKECSSSTERIYKAGLYARISVENERKRESDTIGTQIQLLKDFASERDDIKVVDVYCDDDISGTDFLRPRNILYGHCCFHSFLLFHISELCTIYHCSQPTSKSCP